MRTRPLKAPRGKLIVRLALMPNPDFGPGSPEAALEADESKVVKDIRQARDATQKFIRSWNAGGGNWVGGQVFDDKGKQVAQISYNGRVWEPGKYPTPEIHLATDILQLAHDVPETRKHLVPLLRKAYQQKPR